MNRTDIHLHLVSDATGGTLTLASRAAASLRPEAHIVEHIHSPVLSVDRLRVTLREIERHPGIVLYSFRNPVMVLNLTEACSAIGCWSLAMPKPSGDSGNVAPDPALSSAIRLHLEAPSRTWFGAAAGIFAGVLALQALWVLPVALFHPTIAFPSADAATAQAAATQEGVAHASALIGLVRADLWADYAFTLASEPLGVFEKVGGVAAPQLIDAARSAARRAAELAPHDSRVWLLLAALDLQADRYKDNVSNELKNSYYTGPNERALRPLRINVAVASNAIADSELQSLVTQEIRSIIIHDPALKPTIINAYRHGSADGRRFLEDALMELDPSLLDVVRKG